MLIHKKIVITQPELDAALVYLRSQPFSRRPDSPESWAKKELLENILTAIGKIPQVGKTYPVAPGLYAQVHYFGTDLVGGGDGRLQVWLLLRPESNPNKLIDLN